MYKRRERLAEPAELQFDQGHNNNILCNLTITGAKVLEN